MVDVHQGVVTQSMNRCQLHCGRYTWQKPGGTADRRARTSEGAVDAFHNLIHFVGPGGSRGHANKMSR